MTSKENLCGLGSWRPNCLQVFASSKSFIVVFGLLGTVQAMSYVYFVATLTTLEKRFQIPSETMGILMSGNEISQILLVVFLAYLGGKGNRPVWIAWGVSISALSSFVLAAPHLIYGAGDVALALTEEHLTNFTAMNATSGNTFTCNAERIIKTEEFHPQLVPMVIIFLSQFVLGIGTSLYFSIGQTYLDDNTKRSSTPMMLGITMCLRTLGPALGFQLGSLCLGFYIDPTLTPIIERKDPRWLGAWWLGWVILGSAMMLFAGLMAFFPKELKKKDWAKPDQWNPIYKSVPTDENQQPKPTLYDPKTTTVTDLVSGLRRRRSETKDLEVSFLASVKRVLKSAVLLLNNFAAVFYILGASGYMIFFNKYVENQFGASASYSNMLAGISILFSLVLGFLISGFVISRFKPRTSYLLLWNIFVGCIYIGGQMLLLSFNCPENNYFGNYTANGRLNTSAECNLDCGCNNIRYSPVCDTNTNMTYFSACHAGCSVFDATEMGKKVFTNCVCAESPESILAQGPCPVECGYSLMTFIAVVCTMQLLGCTGRITNVLINYRSVDTVDKSVAQGIALFIISLFALIPGPIIFGRIVDNACLIWDTDGDKGNCWLYDKTSFRVYVNATAASFTAIAAVLDVFLWIKGRKIKIYE